MYANCKHRHRLICHVVRTILAVAWVLPANFVWGQSRQNVDYYVVEDQQRLEMVVNSSRIMVMDEDIPRVLVNNKEILRVVPLSPTQVQVSALKPGVTQVNLWNQAGHVRSVDVIVYPDARQLEMVLRAEFPNAAIRIRPLENSVVLAGYVDKPEEIGPIISIAENYYPKIINNISVGGVQQVAMHAKVMEVSRTKARAAGFDFSWTNGTDFVISRAAGIAGTASETIRFGIIDGNNEFIGNIEALQARGLIKILAEPTLVTVSGRPASFLAGGEFPIIIAQGIGANSVEFKQFGTRVDFVPIVLGNGNIRLEVRPQVSELDESRGVELGGYIVPGLRTRWVDTAAEMRSGQTLALAGLIQSRTEAATRGVPFLADLPYTGALFRRVREEVNEIELLVLVRPELVTAMDPDQVPATGPGEHTCSPSDCDLYWRGYLEVPRCCPDPHCTDAGGTPLGVHMSQDFLPRQLDAAGPATGTYPASHPPMPYEYQPGLAPYAEPQGPPEQLYFHGEPTAAGPPPGASANAGNIGPNPISGPSFAPEMFGPSGYDNLDY